MSNPANPIRVTVVGIGAIGGILAVHLASTVPVSVVARGATLEGIRTSGLTLIKPGGDTITQRLPASDDPDDLNPADVVVVAVKAHSLPDAVSVIARAARCGALVVFVQNGLPWWYASQVSQAAASLLDPHGRLRQAVANPAGGVTYLGGTVLRPGVIRQFGGGRVALAAGGSSLDGRLAELSRHLIQSGLQSYVVADLAKAIWTKLATNVALNATAVLTRASITEILDAPGLRPALQELAADIGRVANSLGHSVNVDWSAQDRMVEPGQLSSTLQDLIRGQPLEFEALFGAPKLVALERQVATPTLDLILPLVRAAGEQGARRPKKNAEFVSRARARS